MFAGLMILLSLGFALAQESKELVISEESKELVLAQDTLVSTIDAQTQPYSLPLSISLNSPSDGSSFETSTVFNVNFLFNAITLDRVVVSPSVDSVLMDSKDAVRDVSFPQNLGKTKCFVKISGDSDFEVLAQISSDGLGSASKELSPGSYDWMVKCVNSYSGESFSESRDFVINEIVVNNNNQNGNGGGSSNNDDESNGRRLQPISLPLEELSTENQSSDDEDGGFISSITGAVIGAVGKRGATGLIVLVVVLAVVGIVVYNRRKLGAVKEAK